MRQVPVDAQPVIRPHLDLVQPAVHRGAIHSHRQLRGLFVHRHLCVRYSLLVIRYYGKPYKESHWEIRGVSVGRDTAKEE